MQRVFSIILGITTLAVVASGLTEAAMALGQHQTTSPEPTVKKTVVATPKAATTIMKVTPSTTPTTPATPAPPTATVNGFVHMRSSATTDSSILFDLNAGDTVTYTTVDPGLWQSVVFHGFHGYIYKSYLNY